MTQPAIEPPLELSAEAERIAEIVAAARALIAKREAVDLAPLEGRVAHLCDAIRRAPADAARAMQGSLAKLLEGLDRLETDVRRQHEVLLAQGQAAPAARAAGAYRQATKGARKPPGE